jgi:Na+/H+ antiporter
VAAMSSIDTAFVLLALILLTALVARRLTTPTPILFAAVGIAAGLCWHTLPFLPPVTMPPGWVLFVFLPPLLFTAAYALPLESVRRNLLPIGLLAIGLVLATMLVGAAVGHWMAGLPWAAALVLGAIVAPPDPVAATAIAARTGLPHRLVVILEGEGLVNDAVAIVAFGIAVKAAVSGQFAWSNVLLELLKQAPIGIAVGLAVGWAAREARMRIDSVPLEVGISIVSPYLAYHLAERFGGSGVLAVVTLGFLLRRFISHFHSPAARLAARTVWGAFRYASTALVFLLLGLLLGETAIDWPGWPMLWVGVDLAVAVIALRMVWMWLVPRLVAAINKDAQATSNWRQQTVLGWAGMRGVVSLALALALPMSLDPGEVRSTIIFMTFVVIFATLLVQGATLLPLIRLLGVGDPHLDARDEARARARARRAGIKALRNALHHDAGGLARAQRLLPRIADGSIGIAGAGADAGQPGDQHSLIEALHAQREVVARLRDAGRLGESVAERLETELDMDELGAGGEADRLTGAAE